MLTLTALGEQIAGKRKTLGLSQARLASKASVARSTLDALENGRLAELGFSRVSRILSALGMELTFQESRSRRPTLEELMAEERNDQGVDGRR